MTKTMHKSALIVLSYFTLFFPFFSKGLEMHFVEPVNFGLFCVVVSLCVSTALEKKAVEYLISLIKRFYSSQFGAENKFLENWDLWRVFFTISKYRRELRFQSTFPVVPHFPVLVCSITTTPCHTQCIPQAFLSALPRTEFELSSLPQQTLFTR